MAASGPMTMLEREREALAAAPTHDELVLRLRAVAKDALTSGAPRDEVLAALLDLRTQDPDHEDVVLDVMDFLEGWASPHVSLNRADA